MSTKHVVAAVILHNHRPLVTQRGYGDWKGYWRKLKVKYFDFNV